MGNQKYDLNGLYTMRAEGSDAQLTIGAYNGSASLVVFQDKKLAVKCVLNRTLIAALIETGRSLKKAPPATRLPIKIQDYDRNNRKYELSTTIVMGKDESQVIYLEIKPKNGAPFTFKFNGIKSIQFTSEPMNDAARSDFDFKIFIEFLATQLSTAIMLSRFDMEKKQFSGNSGGKFNKGGKFNNSNNGNHGGSSNDDDEGIY